MSTDDTADNRTPAMRVNGIYGRHSYIGLERLPEELRDIIGDEIHVAIRQAQARTRQAVLAEVRAGMPKKRNKTVSHEDLLMHGGFNQAVSFVNELLTKLSEEGK